MFAACPLEAEEPMERAFALTIPAVTVEFRLNGLPTAINQGNSGGALVNAKGELVGINAMLYSPTGAYSGYGFAIPTSIMTKVVADLKQFGTVQRALLGIKGSDLSTDLQMDESWTEELKKKADELGVKEGIYVAEVVEGGSAAGILKENDVIIALNGKKIHKFSDLQEMLAKHRPGDKVKVTVVRDKKEKEFEITLKNDEALADTCIGHLAIGNPGNFQTVTQVQLLLQLGRYGLEGCTQDFHSGILHYLRSADEDGGRFGKGDERGKKVT